MMSDIINQFKVDNHTKTILKRMTSSVPVSISPDLARAMTKGLRGMTFASSPFVDASLLGKDSFEAHQEKMKEFYRRNPTPACVKDNDNDEDTNKVHIPVHSTATNQPLLVIPAAFTNTNPPPEFYAQLIETMKNIQAPQHPSKIVVKSRDYEDTIDLAKLQNGMLQLMYATGDVIWDNGIIKNI